MESIYLDYAATTPLRAEVRESLLDSWSEFGNPSSLHRWGRGARVRLEEARERVSALLGAARREIVFTGSGTESDNLAILGRWRAWRHSADAADGVVVCSAIEHSAVLGSVRAAGREGAEVVILGVDGDGRLDTGALEELLPGRPAIVSVMWANNEVGTLQPISALAERCRAAGTIFHSDAVQALGRERIRLDEVPCDLLTISAHKIGGPAGIGALFIREGVELEPLVYGGGQEQALRAGTESVAAAVGFAVALELAEREREAEAARLAELRDRLQAELLVRIPGALVNGGAAPRLPHILNISIPGVDREVLLMALDLEGIAASGGSACRSGTTEPSHVLVAMGQVDQGSTPLRLSLGRQTTAAEVDRAIEIIAGVVTRVRALAQMER
jgi:cysteine desulfurase